MENLYGLKKTYIQTPIFYMALLGLFVGSTHVAKAQGSGDEEEPTVRPVKRTASLPLVLERAIARHTPAEPDVQEDAPAPSSEPKPLSFGFTVTEEEEGQAVIDQLWNLRHDRAQWTRLYEEHQRSEQDFSTRAAVAKAESAAEGGRIIATFDGGGIRGGALGREVHLLSEEAGISVPKMFDAVGGTSVGSILAAAIATKEFDGQMLEDLFIENGPLIFSTSWGRRLTNMGGLVRPKYDRTNLDLLLTKYLGKHRLSTLPIPFAAVAVGQPVLGHGYLDTPVPITFRTADARRNSRHDLPLNIVTGVSASAPGYFASIPFTFDETHYMGMDGGLIANSPRMEVVMNAVDQWGGLNKDDVVLTFGTGDVTKGHTPPGIFQRGLNYINPFHQGGVLENASGVLGSFMDAQTTRSRENMDRLLSAYGVKHNYDLNFPISECRLDDTSLAYREELIGAADIAVKEWAPKETVLELIRHRVEARE